MTALARAADGPDSHESDGATAWDGVRLHSLLAALANRHPSRVAFADQPEREAWSGRPRIAWTYAQASEIVGRLATALARLGLPAGAPVAICLPNGSEASLAILAVERAGCVPCLIPMGWPESLIGQALESAQAVAVIGQGRVAEERPVERLCRLAARYFGLRFVCAFGPGIPDGVIDLDRAILDSAAVDPPREGPGGLVTFTLEDGAAHPVFRPHASSLAATVNFLVPQRIEPGERILSLLAPDDHRSLVTGLLAALATGAALEGHGLPDGASLAEALASGERTHLVAPGWCEPFLAKAELPECVASVVLVHEAPVRFKARGLLRHKTIDVLAFGELALLSRARNDRGYLALSLDETAQAEQSLLRLRRDEDGTLHFGGAAAEIQDFAKGAPLALSNGPEWRDSGFKTDVFAGIVIGVR